MNALKLKISFFIKVKSLLIWCRFEGWQAWRPIFNDSMHININSLVAKCHPAYIKARKIKEKLSGDETFSRYGRGQCWCDIHASNQVCPGRATASRQTQNIILKRKTHEPGSPALQADSLSSEPPEKPHIFLYTLKYTFLTFSGVGGNPARD